jgi:putative oxidoreductase
MKLPPIVVSLRQLLLRTAKQLSWLGPLLARITVGVTFIGTGWGKLHSLDDVTSFFTELHIPAPHFNAILAASAEFFCGAALLLGILTRLASLPLIVTMIVAIVTAKIMPGKVDGVVDFLGLEEWTYIVVFLWLFLAGPGPVSVDHLLARATKVDEPHAAADRAA